MAISWSREAQEFIFILNDYLLREQHWLKVGSSPQVFQITPKGWTRLHALERRVSDSVEAFVAMWFNPATDNLWKQAIRPGCYAAGYRPVRIDNVEHVDKIDDEIVAHLRSCKFVIADFTDQRGGVYFEADLPWLWASV